LKAVFGHLSYSLLDFVKVFMSSLAAAMQRHIPANSASPAGDIFVFVYLSVLIAVLPLPTWIALWRRRPGAGKTLLANLFLSWTVVDWFLAPIFAFRDPGRKVTEHTSAETTTRFKCPVFVQDDGSSGMEPMLQCLAALAAMRPILSAGYSCGTRIRHKDRCLDFLAISLE
jgi:hypothetical protein